MPEGCESVFKCYPMILFLVCFLCGCIGNVISISGELTSDDNLEQKLSKSGAKLLSIICGFLCCTVPCFFIIKMGCDSQGCNSILGWIFSIGPTILICCCLMMISIGGGILEATGNVDLDQENDQENDQ